jgi:hypothetical protein
MRWFVRRVLGRHGPCIGRGKAPFLMISLSPQKLRLLLTATAWTLMVSAVSLDAVAQIKPTIQAIDKTQIRRSQGLRSSTNFPYWVSRQDCLADDVLTFKVQVVTPNTDQFEVWAGTADCTQKTERQGTTANCWRLYSKNVVKSPADIQIRAQDIVAQHSVVNGGGLGVEGTEAECKPKYQAAGLYFMYINDSGDVSSNTVKFSETGVDTEGPITPEVTDLLPSDGRLIVNWANNNPTEFAGYQIYCNDAVEAETAESALTLADGAVIDGSALDTSSAGDTLTSTLSDGVSLDTASNPTTTDSVSAAAQSVAPTDAGAKTSDAGTSTGVPGCGGSGLKEGTFPSSSQLCGEVSSYSATTGYAENLTNGRSYAVGLTAVDRLGNESYLSNVVCNSPREVFTFYEDYKDAGGGGGGGFCSLTTTPASARNTWQLWSLVSIAICLGLFRRINNT